MSLFVTGTDTDVGKTFVAVELVRRAREAGFDSVGFKPICCGERSDAEALCAASGGAVTLNEVNPMWFRVPAAPLAAAMIENRPADLALVRETANRLRARHRVVIAEGAGGWLVPVEEGLSMGDLAVEWGWPVVVVAANRLGALNHTLLTVQAIHAAGLTCPAIILNHPSAGGESPATATNRAILEKLLDLPVLEVPHGGPLPDEAWVTLSSSWATGVK